MNIFSIGEKIISFLASIVTIITCIPLFLAARKWLKNKKSYNLKKKIQRKKYIKKMFFNPELIDQICLSNIKDDSIIEHFISISEKELKVENLKRGLKFLTSTDVILHYRNYIKHESDIYNIVEDFIDQVIDNSNIVNTLGNENWVSYDVWGSNESYVMKLYLPRKEIKMGEYKFELTEQSNNVYIKYYFPCVLWYYATQHLPRKDALGFLNWYSVNYGLS